MKVIAIIGNISVLLLITYFYLVKDGPKPSEEFMVALMISTCICSIWVIYKSMNSNGWIYLYFKRKSLEEQAKIDDIIKNKQ